MQLDIELALTGVLDAPMIARLAKLPQGYNIEDRSKRGWGLVLRTRRKVPTTVDEAISEFLIGIISIKDPIRAGKGILRIAVHSETVNTTVNISVVELICDYRLQLEISIYPTSS
jgi:hypothetical protein